MRLIESLGFIKPTVYIETSVISYLTARLSNDVRVLASQSVTLEWWEAQRPNFELFISEFVVSEAGLGNPEAAQRRLTALEGIAELRSSPEVDALYPSAHPHLPPQALICQRCVFIERKGDLYVAGSKRAVADAVIGACAQRSGGDSMVPGE